MFIDASAIFAILNEEPEAPAFERAIESHRRKIFVSPIARFEAAVSLAAARRRKSKTATTPQAIALATQAVDALLEIVKAQDTAITSTVRDRAIAAAATYGRAVGHKAYLNLGDCFAYAIAKNCREPILFKGDDFIHTDLEAVIPPPPAPVRRKPAPRKNRCSPRLFPSKETCARLTKRLPADESVPAGAFVIARKALIWAKGRRPRRLDAPLQRLDLRRIDLRAPADHNKFFRHI